MYEYVVKSTNQLKRNICLNYLCTLHPGIVAIVLQFHPVCLVELGLRSLILSGRQSQFIMCIHDRQNSPKHLRWDCLHLCQTHTDQIKDQPCVFIVWKYKICPKLKVYNFSRLTMFFIRICSMICCKLATNALQITVVMKFHH